MLKKPFYLLTKGSGISYKGSGAGGSKGIESMQRL